MVKVLFVCHGNICRSPMAEFVMKDLINKEGDGSAYEIASAATSREEIGNDIHWGTKRKLEEMNIPYATRSARQLCFNDYERYDYIIGMDDANIRNILRITKGDKDHKVFALLDFSNHPRAIADPWYTGDFNATYCDILEGCKELIKKVKYDYF